MPKITVQNLKINYVEAGEKDPAVILLHGAGGSYNLWLRQVEGLKTLRRIIALDLPGHGASEGEGFETIGEYRDFLRDFMQALGLNQAILGGHSMGGAIVLATALTYPESVEALMLVGTGARLRVSSQIFEVLQDNFEGAVKLISRAAYSPEFPQHLLSLGESELKKITPQVLERDFRACNIFNLMASVKDISHPALILCGKEDILTPPKYSQYLKEQMPSAALSLIEGAGHMVMVEKGMVVNEYMADFIKNLE